MNTNKISTTNIMSKEALEATINNIYENGLPKGLHCGSKNLDELFHLDRGKLVTVTGIPNMGKSEFIDFLTVQYNKLYGMKTLYYSPENQPIALHLSKLYRKFDGIIPSKENVGKERLTSMMNYIYENFFFFDYSNEYSVDQVIEVAKGQIEREGVDILVIDSYNKLTTEITNNETEVISRILDRLERFAKAANLIILLVAHPRKMPKADECKRYEIPSAYDINGSANFFNKSDFCITVHRNYDPNYAIVKVDKVKFSNYGGTGTTCLGYDLKSGNYYDIPENILKDGEFAAVPPAPTHVPFKITTSATSRSGMDFLNVQTSCFKNASDTKPYNVNLATFLTTDKYKNQINAMRNSNSDEAKRLKASLPAVTPSVVLKEKRDESHIVSHTGLICVDIDYKDNTDCINKVFDTLKNLPYVAFAQQSASGTGYYALIPIADGDKHLEHFLALEEDFAAKGITIDKSCKNKARLRFYSFDENRYINPATEVYTRRIAMKRQEKIQFSAPKQTASPTFSHSDLTQELDKACQEIVGKNVCPTYQAWFEVGCALANELGEQGRSYYHTLSQCYAGYNQTETDDKYDECLRNEHRYNFSRGTIFHYINETK